MPLPDKHANEPVIVLDPDLFRHYQEAVQAEAGWAKLRLFYRKQIEDLLAASNAFAAIVDDEKVITYRPTKSYAVEAMQRDYPELTKHYTHVVTKEVLDTELFAKAHPEIAEKYHVRSFREVGS